jgi:hypothetical protein
VGGTNCDVVFSRSHPAGCELVAPLLPHQHEFRSKRVSTGATPPVIGRWCEPSYRDRKLPIRPIAAARCRPPKSKWCHAPFEDNWWVAPTATWFSVGRILPGATRLHRFCLTSTNSDQSEFPLVPPRTSLEDGTNRLIATANSPSAP